MLVRVVGALLLLVALAAWSVASPVGASPDEDYHLASIWCGQGEQDGVCEPGDSPGERTVLKAFHQARCFAFEASVGAVCQRSAITDPDGSTWSTDRGNFAGDYPPGYFAVMHLFVGDGTEIEAPVVVMRLVNSLVFVLVAAAAFALAPPSVRRALVLGVFVTLVPLGMFIVSSVNPSSWAITSAAGVFVSALVHMTAVGRRRLLLSGGLLGLTALLGGAARADAALYAAVAIGAALIMTLRLDRAWVLRALYPVLVAVAAGISFLTAGQSAAVEGTGQQTPTPGRIARLLADIVDLWVGVFGRWGLGWLDTGLPALVWFIMFGLFAALVLGALRGLDRRHGVATALVAMAAWLIPAYIQYLSGFPVPSYVQPRYILPLLMLLALVATVRTGGAGLLLSPAQRWFAVVGISVANAIALFTNLRRYVTGMDVGGLNLDSAGEWWWSWGGPTPMTVWFVGSVAFAGALVLLSRGLDAGTEPVGEGETSTTAAGAGAPEPGDAPAQAPADAPVPGRTPRP